MARHIRTASLLMLGALWLMMSAAPSAAAQGGGCNLPAGFECPQARILDFKAEPSSIKPGQSALLIWATENPGTTTITPGVGRALARGTLRVTPAATTTYTLSVTGSPNPSVPLTRTVTITVEGTVPVSNAVATAPPAARRMPDGKPDLQGVYWGIGQRGGGPATGRGAAPAPPAPGELARAPVLKAGKEDFRVVEDPREIGANCLVRTVPVSFGPYQFQIVQTPTFVVQFIEMMHLFRIIPIDGTPHPADVYPTWMGDSVGRWDGDTLVIDTIGFNTDTTVGSGGQTYRHSENLHMVERIRRLDINALEIEVTLEDPDVFAGPWRTVNRYDFRPEYKKVDEYLCNEYSQTYDRLLGPKR